jgi:hypothetical protein
VRRHHLHHQLLRLRHLPAPELLQPIDSLSGRFKLGRRTEEGGSCCC